MRVEIRNGEKRCNLPNGHQMDLHFLSDVIFVFKICFDDDDDHDGKDDG